MHAPSGDRIFGKKAIVTLTYLPFPPAPEKNAPWSGSMSLMGIAEQRPRPWGKTPHWKVIGNESSDIVLWHADVSYGSILLKKSEYRLGPIFSAPWARFSDADAGGLVIRLRLNGASSKSICGGS
jgi:hypothetical protein